MQQRKIIENSHKIQFLQNHFCLMQTFCNIINNPMLCFSQSQPQLYKQNAHCRHSESSFPANTLIFVFPAQFTDNSMNQPMSSKMQTENQSTQETSQSRKVLPEKSDDRENIQLCIFKNLCQHNNEDNKLYNNFVSIKSILSKMYIPPFQEIELEERLKKQENLQSCLKQFLENLKAKEDYQQVQIEQSKTQTEESHQKKQKQFYRQLCIQRYKNKQRNWQKSIQYDSRKLVAENRLRIKGRFISKEDQKNISDLLDQKNSLIQVFDAKKNLDVKKFQHTIKLFSTSKGILKTSKQELLSQIYNRVHQKKQLLSRIQARQQIFQLTQ